MKGGASPSALITGATSGIGKAFAERFARLGYNLIITGRRAGEIRKVASALKKAHGVEVRPIIAEFARERDLLKVIEAARGRTDIEVLVNNAGFGARDGFLEGDIAEGLAMMQVHVLAPVRLMKTVLPPMIKRRKGTIINVASMAAFLPLPGSGLYSATKSFLNSFSESMHMTVAQNGVRVQSLCPGFTHTDFHNKLGMKGRQPNRGLLRWMEADEVVDASLKALKRGKAVCIPGLLNRILLRLVSLLPRRLYYRIAARAE